MMASFAPLSLSKKQVRGDLKEFKALLDDPNKPDLSEKQHILPFFKAHPHLSRSWERIIRISSIIGK